MKKTLLALSIIAASGMLVAAETETVVNPQPADETTHGVDIKPDEDAPATQANAKGFLGDDSLTILNRDYYLHNDKRSAQDEPVNPDDRQPNYNEEWAHAILADYVSGYTEGTVGIGIDAHIYSGVKLDTGGGRNRSDSSYPFYLIPTDNNNNNNKGDAEDTWSRGGAAIKARISATELKYGDLRPAAPVYSTGDSFLFPETSTGYQILSGDIKGLAIDAGHFTADSSFVSTSHEDQLLLNYGEGKIGNTIDYAGGFYTASDDLSLGFFASNFSETWNQYYGNVNNTFTLSEKQDINVDFNIYRTTDTGDSYQGEIDNTTYSLAGTYTLGANAFTLSHQRVDGDTPFDYVGYDSIWLSNSMLYSDFNGPEEESYRAAYALDMETLGVPGLTFKAGYAMGNNIDGTNADPNGGYTYYGKDGEHWERDFEVKYVVQSGVAKDLSLRLRQATHRGDADQGEGAIEEVRFVIEYPWDAI